MPIQSHDPETGPTTIDVICDACGLRIERAREGNYHWKFQEPNIYFAHKVCSDDMEAKVDPNGHWCCHELRYFPVWMGNNLKIDWERDLEQASNMPELA